MIDIVTYRMRIGTFGGGTKIQDKIRKVTTLDKKWIQKGHNTLSWTSNNHGDNNSDSDISPPLR